MPPRAHTYPFVHHSLQARLVVDEGGNVVDKGADKGELLGCDALRSGSITLDTPFGFSGAWTDPATGPAGTRRPAHRVDCGSG